jgi:hypothetical protein
LVIENLCMSRALPIRRRQVYAKLLDEGRYLCSIRTMHRLLGRAGESGERRVVRAETHHAFPRLLADAPNVVSSWDITRLATWSKGIHPAPRGGGQAPGSDAALAIGGHL